MAEIIEAMPTRDGRHRYDWESMTDGQPRRMRRGRDFHCKPRSLRSAALAYARRRGIKSQIRVLGDEVYVQLGDPAAALGDPADTNATADGAAVEA